MRYIFLLVNFCLVCFVITAGCASKPIIPPAGEAIEIPASPEVEADYQKAETLYYAKNYSGAYNRLKKLLPRAKNPAQHEKIIFLMAESVFQRKSYEQAYNMYEEVVTLYPKTERLNDIIDREYEIGFAFVRGVKRTFLGLPILPSSEYGMVIIRKTIQKYPYTPASEKNHMILADYLYKQAQYSEARLEYEAFLKTYTQSIMLNKSQFMMGMCYLKEYQGSEYDITPLKDAKKEFQEVMEKSPDEQLKEDIQKQLTAIMAKEAERDYLVGEFYRKTGKKDAARKYFQSVVTNYPQTEWAKKAERMLNQK